MSTYVKYSDYDKMIIEDVRMDIDCEQYKILKPTTRTIKVDDVETIEHILQIKTIDERMVYELVQDIDQKELASLIRILQSLNKQIIAGNIPESNSSNGCIKQ